MFCLNLWALQSASHNMCSSVWCGVGFDPYPYTQGLHIWVELVDQPAKMPPEHLEAWSVYARGV